MAGLDNLNSNLLARLEARVAKLEMAPAATNTAIGRSGLLVYDGGVITIENGGLDVTGSASISGTLNVTGTTSLSGSTSMSGPTDVSGAFTVTGVTKLNGNTTINGTLTVTNNTDITGRLIVTGNMATRGTLSVEGVTTLRNDLILTTGAEITAGATHLYPSGRAVFGSFVIDPASAKPIDTPYGAIYADGSGISLYQSAMEQISVGGGEINAQAGGKILSLSNSGFRVLSLPTTSSAANVYYDSGTGYFYVKS